MAYELRNAQRQSPWNRVLTVATVLLLAVLALLGWHFRDVRLLSVQSGSMAPLMQRGDAVVVRGKDAGHLRLGEIISYRSPLDSSMVVTHRIVGLRPAAHVIITQGDRLPVPDPQISEKLVVGRAVSTVPYAGLVLDWLHSPYGLALAVYSPAAIVAYVELKRLARHFAQGRYRRAGRAY